MEFVGRGALTELSTQRLRDPVHGLITFRAGDPLDQLARSLIDTPEFQRLRRIRQLGVSEFVFPGATHTRFAHCIGVFHIARTLVGIIEREIGREKYEPDLAGIAVIAALLHDLGHGPFSHTFENVQKSRGVKKRHEQWTADIIRNPNGALRPLLDGYGPGFCDAVAGLLEAEDPINIYHAVVSSSFDADRLDYLQRDRLMTGTKAGVIDFDWLMEQVRVAPIIIEAPDAEDSGEPIRVPTFCFDTKALPAAEQFLLARYTLHEQVYFHKTTRCVEKMIAKLLSRVADLAEKKVTRKQIGLGDDHPLVKFFDKGGAVLANYQDLDDVAVTQAFQTLCDSPDAILAELARRLRDRRLYKALDLGAFGHDEGRQRRMARRIADRFKDQIDNGQVIKDDTAVSIYTQIGGDDDRAHKKLHILDAHDGPVEIPKVSTVIEALGRSQRTFTRYYFENESDRDAARHSKREGQ
jgi:HD superfamily phosphohydrolase